MIFVFSKILEKRPLLESNELLAVVGIIILCAKYILFATMSGEYIYGVTLHDVIMEFVFLPVWFLFILGVFYVPKRILLQTFCFVAILSPLFVLWRPLISVLPIVAVYAAVGFRTMIRRNSMLILLLVACLLYSYGMIGDFMSSMLWEMEAEPGIVDRLPRSLNSSYFRDLYFGGMHECEGSVDMYNNVVERCL
jgi:hypothetical protein